MQMAAVIDANNAFGDKVDATYAGSCVCGRK